MGKYVAACVVAAALVVRAQTPQSQQPPTFRSAIDLVQVDVVVTDEHGEHVRGLTSADFRLVDRGTPQTIATFEEFSRETAPLLPSVALPSTVRRDVSNNQAARAGRLIVMVVDDLHIYKERTDRTKGIARKVLADLGPESSMAVLFTSGGHSTQVTSDPALLGAALDTLKGRQSWRRPHQASDRQSGQRLDPEANNLEIVSRNQEINVQDFFDNMAQYKTLQDAARLLGGGDARRKAFVLLSEGIGKDLSGIFGAMRPEGDVPEGGLAYATSGDAVATAAPPANSYHSIALIEMMDALRRSNVATYAIDPRGRIDSRDLARECFPPPANLGDDPCSGGRDLIDWVSPVRQAQHGLEMISDASGGFAITNTDDFTGGIARIVDDLDQYYLLGFHPSDAKGRGYRLLGVTIPGHPEWKLRFRRGYMAGGAPPEVKDAGGLAALSAGVLPRTDLPLRLTAIASPGAAANLAHVVLTLEVSAPLRDLQDADGKVRDTLEYDVLVVDAKKSKVRSVGGLEGRLVLSPSADASGPPPETVSYQVSHAVDVQPGRFEFRVSAASGKLGKGGSVYLEVDVPDFRASPLALGGIAIGYAEGARVPVAPSTGSRADAASAFPITLDRVFSASDTLRVQVEGVARDAASLSAAIEVIDSASGAVISSHSPSVTPGDPLRIAAELPLRGLTPGAYLLRVILRDGAKQAVREAGFAIK